MTDYLKAARKASDPDTKRRFIRLHKEHQAREAIVNCTDCPLSKSRRNAVPWSGPMSSPLVLVGEAPGGNEDKQGVPFVGAAGRVLNSALSAAGLDRDDVMVMNSVQCRPPGNRNPTDEERNACQKHRDRQLGLSASYVGVLLGLQAVKALTGEDKVAMRDLRGNPFWQEGRVWVPTYHPAYIARNRSMRGVLVGDLVRARQLVQSGLSWPPVDVSELELFQGDQAATLRKRLDRDGSVRLYSKRLRDVIVVLDTDSRSVPEKWRDYPRYTVEELVRVGELAKAQRLSGRELRQMHFLKQAFAADTRIIR